MEYYNRRTRRKYQRGGMRQDFNVRSAFADEQMNREFGNYFDTMYGSYVPYDSDDDSDNDEYYTDEESDTDDNEYHEVDESFEPKQNVVSKKTLRHRRSAMPIVERPIESQESNSIDIFSNLDLEMKSEVHVVLDSELCEIIPFNCKVPGYRLYTLIFEISIIPFKYMRLKDVIVNKKRLSESMPLALKYIYGTFDDVIDRINGILFYTDSNFLPESILEEYNLNVNIGLIGSQIQDGNIYEQDTNIFMIETRNFFKKKFTLILDFNRESLNTDIDIILHPDVTVTRCTRENSSNHCQDTSRCSPEDCRSSITNL